jgi:hypothetical protein
MPTTYKVLGQVQTSTLGASTEGDLYTVPAATTAVVSTIAICNLTGTAATYRIAVRPAADATTANKHWIVFGATVAASDSSFLTLGVTLAAGDKIRVFGSTTTLSFSAFGSEIS